MKLIKILFLVQFIIVPSITFADGPLPVNPATPKVTTKTTPHGFDPWCASAEDRIASLNKTTKDELEKIRKTALEINDYKAQKVLLADFLKVRDDYEKEFEIFKNDKKKGYVDRLTTFRKIINSSLILTVINDLASGKNKDKDIHEYCKQDNTSALCKGAIMKLDKDELDVLNVTLTNAKMALSHSRNPEQLKASLEKIYDSIPQNISPEDMLKKVAEINNGEFLKALNASKKSNKIKECINSNYIYQDICREIVRDEEAKEVVKQTLLTGMNDIQREFMAKKIDENFKELDDGQKAFDLKRKEIKNRANKDFLVRFNGYSDNEIKKLRESGFKTEELVNFRNICTADNDADIDLEKCEIATRKFIDAFSAKSKSLQDLIDKSEAELKDLTSSAGLLAITEKMKQYLSQRYLRSCKTPDAQKAQSSLNCNNISQTFAGIDSLGVYVNSIVGTMSDNSLSRARGDHGPFSKPELEVYLNFCNTTSANTTYADICNNIIEDANAVRDKKEAKEWEQFHKDYWVVYDKTATKGYSVYSKKSNWRIL